MKEAFEEYLKINLAESFGENHTSEIYSNGWVYLTGLSCQHPHPHRHFTFEEFVERCQKDENFNKRFVK